MRRKLSTSTVSSLGEIVPWLSSSGELSYSPEFPPSSDYYFQYGRVLPEVIDPECNHRRLYYFGHPYKEKSELLFDFWNQARQGRYEKVYQCNGKKEADSCTTPIAVYRHYYKLYEENKYILIQHGSYQIVDVKEQPQIQDGFAILYRGIGKSSCFRQLYYDLKTQTAAMLRDIANYYHIQYQSLLDSSISFRMANSGIFRCEADFLNAGDLLFYDLAMCLNIEISDIIDSLRVVSLQSYTLREDIVKYKFGPNYIKLRVPLDNLRITTFFAGEEEARIINPNRLEILESVRCKAEKKEISSQSNGEVSLLKK